MALSKVEWNMARNSLSRKWGVGSAGTPLAGTLRGLAVGLLALGLGVETASAQAVATRGTTATGAPRPSR